MVQGVEVDLFKPDDELRRLAKLAVETGVDGALLGSAGDVDAALTAVAQQPRGQEWIAVVGGGQGSVVQLLVGQRLLQHRQGLARPPGHPARVPPATTSRASARATTSTGPTAAIAAERDRITDEYRALIADDETRAAFDEKLGLSRMVFPYVENHNFYVEHWALSLFWRKIRQLGGVLSDAGFWPDADDIFYVRRDELQQVIYDYGSGWATGADVIGPHHWPQEVERRKKIIAALESRAPRPAMNEPPDVVTEPFTIMLYGITTDSVNGWLAGSEVTDELRGMPASSGTAEGVARVIDDASDLADIKEGEILVARITAPSWGPVFARIRACVTDIGGMMSHAAIVCREYGLPAVTGTGSATTAIETGRRIRVDGASGTVTLLD